MDMANKTDLVYRGQRSTISKLPYHGTNGAKVTPLKQEARRKAVTATQKRVTATPGVSKLKDTIR